MMQRPKTLSISPSPPNQHGWRGFLCHNFQCLQPRRRLMSSLLTTFLSALGIVAVLSAPSRAESQRDLPFQGLAQANCNFYNIRTGYLVAMGNDLGTIDAGRVNGRLQPVPNEVLLAPNNINTTGTGPGDPSGGPVSSGGFSINCNADTAIYIFTPKKVVAPAEFQPTEARAILRIPPCISGPPACTPSQDYLMAFTTMDSNPTLAESRSESYLYVDPENHTYNIDMNLRTLNTGVPVGSYKYTVRVMTTPL